DRLPSFRSSAVVGGRAGCAQDGPTHDVCGGPGSRRGGRDHCRPGSENATGETYAFDKNGLLLSQSRFDDQLKSFGLLPDLPDSRSILNLELRDPGADLRKDVRAKKPRREQELTKMAKSATAGGTGFDVDGYRDYRGVPVVGAWTWLEDYGM